MELLGDLPPDALYAVGSAALGILARSPPREAIQHGCNALGLLPVGGLSGAVEHLPPDLVDADRGALLGGSCRVCGAVLPPADPLVDGALGPVQREGLVQKIENAALPWVALGVRLIVAR